MKPRRLSLLSLALCLFAAGQGALHAKLVWESTTFEATLPAGEEKTETRLSFKNEGSLPVKIQAVRSTCGCVVGTPDKQEYQPGEAGKLHVQFDAKGAVGRQDKTLSVETVEGKEPGGTYPLSVRVNVTEWLSISPRLLLWTRAGEPLSRQVTLEVAPETKAEVTAVASDNPVFDTKLTLEAPGKWALKITPTATTHATRGVVTVTLKRPGHADLKRIIHARVQ